jgi:hypothetical protein
LLILGKGLAFLAMIGLLTHFVLPWLLARLARSQELLVLFAIAWAVMLGAVGDAMGFSKEVGAFLAGISIASTEYREAIGARLVTLRDFLLLFFFIDLGARLEMSVLGNPDRQGGCIFPPLFSSATPDRDGDHGNHGISPPHGLYGRTCRGSDQRVFAHPRGSWRESRTH